jgi:monoamine oxidase
LIYTAGQVGRDKNGVAPKSYEEQVRLAFQNLQECLVAAGATPADIVKLTYYIVDYSPKNRYHAKVLEEFLNGHRPPSTLIPITHLARPEYKFEIEAVAAIRDLHAIPPIVRPAPAGSLTVDVVVVGGGLSGLQAAHDVQRQGFSCVVLEARDRVGGKTWSQPTENGSVVDVGAAWINDSNQSKMFTLSKRFGLELIEQLSDGKCAAQVQGKDTSMVFRYGEIPEFSEKEKLDIIRIRAMWEELCHTIDIRQPYHPEYDSLTVEKFTRKHGAGEKALATVSIWTRAFLGCEPSELSALYFLDYCKSGGGLLQMRSDRKDGGQYLRVRTGISLANFLSRPRESDFNSRNTIILN